jgi:hypothetical protein
MHYDAKWTILAQGNVMGGGGGSGIWVMGNNDIYN